MKAKAILGIIFSTALISSTLTYQITTYISGKSKWESGTETPSGHTDKDSLAFRDRHIHTQADISEPAHPKKAVDRESDDDSEDITALNRTSGSPNFQSEKTETVDRIRKTLVAQQKHIRSLQNFAQSNKDKSIIEQTQRNYEAEEINYDWAFRKEDSLLSLFNTHKELTSFSPLDVSCKSKNCQLILAAETEEQAQTIYQSFLAAVIKNQSHSEQTVSYFTHPGDGHLVMYVSESERSNLFE